ncbi:amino acid adenylation domain-containing protein, partial [Corallococcus interemptor]|uniref:amino acid adenylation domain-containing protein n=1 Tax=Corallococcus interemptor TaxID=2316720 RepID=UPI003CFF2BF7
MKCRNFSTPGRPPPVTDLAPRSLSGLLLTLAQGSSAHAPLYTFLGDDGEESVWSASELDVRARRIASALRERGAAGERVLLLYPPGLDYIAGFFGCLYAGAVAVPAYPPDPMRLERTLPRLRAIIQDAKATVVLTTSGILELSDFVFEQAPDFRALHWMATDSLPEGGEREWVAPELGPESLAFLQYTSGSTGTPKGVMLTHGNLLHNLSLIHGAFGARRESQGVIWLPPYHDMGLIGGILEPLYGGFPVALMSPMTFLKRPMAWLEAVSRFGGTISGGPNFAFDLCVKKSTPEERRALDLSRWEVAFCGAEPIRPETLERFVEAFGPSGFRREAFYPCYGLAEGTLIVSGGEKSAPPVSVTLSSTALEQHRAEEVSAEVAGARTLVGCGRTLAEQRLTIVDPETLERRAPGQVGEIWVSGPSVAQGYWGREDVTRETFQARIAGDASGPYLRTGDLGFLRPDGELYVTGRRKDLLILRGRNHYPQDLEATVEAAHPALRPGGGAVFSVEVAGEERAVVVQEIDVRRLGDLRQKLEVANAAVGAIRQRLAESHEVQAHAVVLIEPGSLPKTSSGKVQRHACRAAFLNGTLQEVMAWRAEVRTSSSNPGAAASFAPGTVTAEPITAPASGASTATASGSAGGTAAPDFGASIAAGAVMVGATTSDSGRNADALVGWLRDIVARHARMLREDIDVDAPVTRYGLDSLGAVDLAHEVGSGMGLTVPMEWLLQGPSITSLAHRLASLRDTAGSAPRRRDLGGDREASSSQARLFFLSKYAPGDVSYNLPAAVRLEGSLDVAALEGSLVALAARHEGLRTSFREAPGQPRQIISADASLPLARVSLESLPAEAREAEALRLAHEEARRPFDLERGPLVRATLLTLDARTHVLVLVMHHAVSDATSMAVLVRDVSAIYAALREGRPSPLPALPLDYADAADWQREALSGAALESRLDYWRTQLSGAPQLLELATDRPRPARRGSAGARVPVVLDARLADSVRTLAEREGVTPFMILLTAFQTVLARHAGQDDVSVGTAIAGRQRAEFQGLVGLFVNSLVLRTRLSGAPSFRELLNQVRDTALGAYAHQDVPFERVVEALRPPRELGYTPLFQVMFNLQGARVDAPVLPGLQSRLLDVHTGTSMFDLTLSLAESPEGFEGWLEYATELFDADTVARLAGHFLVLLEAAIAAPDTPILQLPWMTAGERHQVLTAWNETARAYPSGRTLPEQFALQVARTPEAIAVEDGDVRLTYAQLEARANPLAHFLRARGVGPDVPVAVCMERSVDYVVSVLAVLKAGGAYVPMDASYPAQRLAFMMEDARPRMLLTTRALRERLRVPDASLPCFFVDALALEGQPVTAPDLNVGPRNLAYVVFTSGSSGRPKGVAVEQRGVLRLVHAEPYLHIGARETGMLFAPLSFDGSVMELWTMLLHGGRLVVFPAHVPAGDMDTLARVVERHAVSFIHLPSGLFSQLVEHRPDILGRLRELHVGGDVVSAAHVRRALESPGRPVINAYGPSECSVAAACFTVERPEQTGASVPIGGPIANTSAYVLDARLQPVPVGVPGELFLGGDGVARGYVSRPELTAERFVPDAYGTTPGARLYRTGDRVRWRADGTLDFLGRTDHQVKVRGFRIELAEVESALRELPEVHEAAVVVREDVPGDKRLVAYAMPRAGQVLEPTRLREALRRKLPDYMVPSLFVALPTLPLNPSGKVDRKALPAPDSEATGRRERYVAPSHPLEERIASTWARELGADRVGTQDHLFNDLGGTSLSVMRLASRLKETLGRDVPVVWLFEHPTVESLAQRLEQEARSPGAPSPAATGHRPREASKGGTSGSIAIIGMAGQFPGARTVEAFWRNLREGVESISRFTPEELEHLPSLPEGFELWYHPSFVPAGGVLDDVDAFDHAFFDMSLREAQFTDPQQRLFLQTAWAALEDAGINPDRYPGAISLYAGAAASGYAEAVRQAMPLDAASFFELNGTATHESLPTKASFKLGLTGESTLLYTACSTGLVAVHLACQSLRGGQSDVALAGATRLSVPQRTGYVAQEGLIFSPDGHCRAFDARAQGTLPGNGVGAVVLKRLEDAVRDGDDIYAVIRGSALNNDGRNKSGFTAPSVQGQAAVISQALANAGVAPEAVGYVEAHGTATPLGDPIEVAALTRAYGLGAEHRGRIALASLKTNVGHLDTAAGLAGLMKAALSLHHGEIPPSLHFERANPQIDFDAGPFFVNTTLRPWPRSETPRFAAVSS